MISEVDREAIERAAKREGQSNETTAALARAWLDMDLRWLDVDARLAKIESAIEAAPEDEPEPEIKGKKK